MTYDLIIVGGGPAGCAAAVYAARKQLKTLMVVYEFGGQSSVSDTIYNWIGTPEISGMALAKSLKDHALAYKGDYLNVVESKNVTGIAKNGDDFAVTVDSGEHYDAHAILITSGSGRRKLEIPGAAEFENKGVMYCATCDGPLFSGMPVVVIGGGNAALEAVLQLAQYSTHVTLLHRSEHFRADAITVSRVEQLPNVTLKRNIELMAITGDGFVSGIVFKEHGETIELPVNAVFVEIGQLPNTDLAKDVATIDEYKKIVVDPMNQRAQTPGIWAAGDCTNGLYHQNNIAAGDAVKAVEDLYIWLKTTK
jgi:alkyl hydroperoxide reductase subunit F